MNPGVRAFLRYTWLAASAVCFTLPLLVVPADNYTHWMKLATENMAVVMFVLAFPGSLLYLLATFIMILMFSVNDLPPLASYLLLWLGFFFTGYLQWFWLMPGLLEKRQLTLLHLDECALKKKRGSQSSRRRRRKRSRAELSGAPLNVYDDAGRTPFERVIAGRLK